MEVKKFIKDFSEELEELNQEDILLSDKFRDYEEWDSMTAMMIIAMVDEKYKVVIDPDELKSCTSVEDIFNLVANKK